MKNHPRRLFTEQLEERLALNGVPFAAAGEVFISAPDLPESDTPFFPAPVTDEEIAPLFPSQTADTGGRFYVGTWYDVNKSGSGDANLCWAAASSNALAYTNWGFAVKSAGATPALQRFIFADDIFNYVKTSFTDEGSRARYAFPWFISGSYEANGWDGWAQPDKGSGGLLPGISLSGKVVHLESGDCGGTLVGGMAGYLERGWGVTLGLGWFQADAPRERTGGHALTVWGYTCDEALEPDTPGYYTGLIVTDSDDGRNGTQTISLEWNDTYQMYRLADYSGGTGWIEDFTCLKPTKPLTGISVAGYYGVCDGQPHSISISGLDETPADQYAVTYWQNGMQLIKAPVYTAVGTHTVTVTVSRNGGEAVWSAPVTVTITEPEPAELAAPEITELVSAGKNSHTVAWTGVFGAAGYELACSADGGGTWTVTQTDTAQLSVKDLDYGTTVLYRVRALGDGITSSASSWSAEKSLAVNPSDLDGDGFIGPGDYSLLSSVWFTAGSADTFDSRADVDGDGFVGPGDFTYLSANWFKTSASAGLSYPAAKAVSLPASTASDGEYYVGTYYDVNKYGDGTDSKLCWAAAAANVLAYTNWGYSTASSGDAPDDWLFSDVQELYDYYTANFTNVGGHFFYAFPWFADGSYSVQGESGWAQVTGDGGGLYPGISIPDVRPYVHYSERGETVVADMTEYLEQGYGVVLAIGWYRSTAPTSRSGGHSVTVWGYTYDDSLDPSDPNYYTGLIITNSDDSYTGTKTFTIQWYDEYSMYRITNYSGGRGWIEDFTCLKPVETLTGVSAYGYSGVYDGQPHGVTVSGIDETGDDEYTVIYNYDGTFSLTSPEYTEPGEYQVVVVAVKNEFDAIWSAPVDILIQDETAEQLDTPDLLSVASAGLNRHQAAWTEVAAAAGYELAWSSDGGVSWTASETDSLTLLVGGLTYGDTVLYRVRAVSGSSGYLTSEWSDSVSLTVCPMDINGNGSVDNVDRVLLAAAWLSDSADDDWDPRCDIDGDGTVSSSDRFWLTVNWLCDVEDDDLRYPPVS